MTQHVPVLRNTSAHSSGVRVVYTHEGDTWWAYADFRFSAADETLSALKHRVRRAMVEVLGPDVEFVEIVND